MGTPKADLLFRGDPLLARVAATLSLAASSVHVVLGVGQTLAAPLPPSVDVVRDETAGQGPVAGLVAGLHACDAELAIVVGCDMPFLDPDLLCWLAAQATGVDAVIPVVDERPQYLHAVFRVAAREAIDRSLAAGVRSVADVIGGLRTRVVTPPQDRIASFTNLNTIDDLKQAESSID
jgi:molybdopterin-guanine dinucleotide biosynthesis protein A